MNENMKIIEERLSLSLNELDSTLLELTDQGFNFNLLLKLRSRLIRATYWSDRLLAELSYRRRSRERKEVIRNDGE